jgi:hypothetical protein
VLVRDREQSLYFTDVDHAIRWAEETLSRPRYSTPLQIKKGSPQAAEDMLCLAHTISLALTEIEPPFPAAMLRFLNAAFPSMGRAEELAEALAARAEKPGKQRYLLAYCVLTAERRRHLNLRRIPVRETAQVLRVSPRTFFRVFVQTGRWAEISQRVQAGAEAARGKAAEALARKGVTVG